MEHTKILVDGHWVNRGSLDEPKWDLMIYPVVTTYDVKGNQGTLVLIDDSYVSNVKWKPPMSNILDIAEVCQDITLHNFGDFTCQDGLEWTLFMTTKIPHLKNSALQAQVKGGYIPLSEIEPKDTDDDLDMWIFRMLSSLTGPRTIHFNKEV